MSVISRLCEINKHGISILVDKKNLEFRKEDKVLKLTSLPDCFSYSKDDNNIYIVADNEYVLSKNFKKIFYKKIIGTYSSLCKNAVTGLTKGYLKVLNIVGSGYRSSFDSKTRILSVLVGYSHPICFYISEKVSIALESNGTVIKLSSYDKQLVSQCAAKIYDSKKRNVYKKTGIYYQGVPTVTKEIKKK